MTVFDLIFVITFLATLVLLAATVFAVIRRRWSLASKRGTLLTALVLLHFGVLISVSVITPRHVLKPGEFLWSDDWGISGISAKPIHQGNMITYELTLRIASRARRSLQRERGVKLYVLDQAGNRYEVAGAADDSPIETQLKPQTSLDLKRTVTLPATAGDPLLIISRGVPFPGSVIIADQDSFLHKKPGFRILDLCSH